MVTPTRSTFTTAVFLQLFRNNSTILVNRLFKLTLRNPTLIYPGIATDILLPEHHGSVTPHKAKDLFLHPPCVAGAETGSRRWGCVDTGELPGQFIDGESPLSPVLMCYGDTIFSGRELTTPASPPLPLPPPAPSRGRAVIGDRPGWPSQEERERETIRRDALPGTVSMENRPSWEGGGTSPAPVLTCYLERYSLTTPASRQGRAWVFSRVFPVFLTIAPQQCR